MHDKIENSSLQQRYIDQVLITTLKPVTGKQYRLVIHRAELMIPDLGTEKFKSLTFFNYYNIILILI